MVTKINDFISGFWLGINQFLEKGAPEMDQK